MSLFIESGYSNMEQRHALQDQLPHQQIHTPYSMPIINNTDTYHADYQAFSNGTMDLQALQNITNNETEVKIFEDESKIEQIKDVWGPLDICKIALDQKLKCETHNVTTSDGYILTMFRMQKNNMEEGAPVTFLQHGLFSDSAMWVLHDKESLAFKLAHEGYDVWLGNNRGCLYSRNHTHLDPKKDYEKFFDFSFYELGKYDAPAQIDYVLNETKHEKLSYIGHSQGTSQMFSALTEDSDLHKKLEIFIALAPIVDLQYTENTALVDISQEWKLLDDISYEMGIVELRNPWEEQKMHNFCLFFQRICNDLAYWFNQKSIYYDEDAWDLQQSKEQSPATVKQLIHYGQIIITGVFKQYDYGSAAQNMERYGTKIPPVLDLSNIPESINIAIFAGDQDTFADSTDVTWLIEQLQDRVKWAKTYENFDHSCYQVGIDMSWTNDLVHLLKQNKTEEAHQNISNPKL